MMRGTVSCLARTLVLVAATAGCSSTTDNTGEVVDVRGTWTYSGTQVSPVAALSGTISVTSQDGETIVGSASWEEVTGPGLVEVVGGAMSGRVIDTSDVDFDVLLSSGTRRHVGRLTADTIRGSWVQVAGGRVGQFVAVRGSH